jgi:hypothetical protein
MNDEHDATPGRTPDPTPDPDQDAEIRALLAELGSGPDGEAMPPEVAARLEDTLALLVAERGREGMTAAAADSSAESTEESNGTGNVVPMRRRWVPRLAAAAAAVIVLGAGGVAAANLGLLGGSSTPMSDQGASSGAGASKAESAPDTAAPSPGDRALEPSATGADTSLPKLSATAFAADVERLLKGRSSLTAPQDETTKQHRADARLLDSCPGPKPTAGAVPSPVRYDGDLAVLVVHPERDGHRLVEAWDCAGSHRLAHAALTP